MRLALPSLLAVLLPTVATAQQWNSPGAFALVERAIARRAGAAADSTLHDYRAVAHGFLFFLGAFGEGLSEPPRLIKTDQLELEVYWKAPGASKQRIIGWRDRAEMPTDIVYHQDHLGIVMNAFGKTIQIGDGDEVQGVPHPFAPGGPLFYDYATGDTITVALPERTIRVVALRVRPKDFQASRLVGTAYLDVAQGDLVRLAFNFTPAAYRDPSLEDVSVVLDYALYEDRWWLPRHQAIEIRRHATVLDLPARGVIRSRWEVDGYVFNAGLPTGWFNGPEISALPKAQRDSFPWPNSLGDALQQVAEPVRRTDLAAVRAEVARVAGRHVLSGWRPNGLAIDGLSELAHVNRVQGVVVGMGAVWRPGVFEGRARASYGFADRGLDGALSLRLPLGTRVITGSVYREVRDIGDIPIVAPVINSLSAQELGDDYGDYLRVFGGRLALQGNLSHDVRWRVAAGRERITSLAVRARPATGDFRSNAALGGPSLDIVTVGLAKAGEGFAVQRDRAFDVRLEGGRMDGGAAYLRLFGATHWLLPVGRTWVLARAQAGLASAELPAHRAFVLGGRRTLLGDSFRTWGGRAAALLHLEWRLPVPFPSVAIGPGARTPRRIIVAPYVATGWSERPVTGTPWRATPGARVTTGVGVEWLGVFRLEAGYGVQSRRTRFAFDVTRDFWSIL